MPLTAPKLDDRKFQDIVDEAKKRIPYYIKEWTDHNVSDPGVTLIELFAWMTDIILYRLNQIPDLHYIKFMDMFGISLRGPVPAKAPVTFWLSVPQPNPVLIPAGTEVASTQTETERSIVFTTTDDFHVNPPVLQVITCHVIDQDGRRVFRNQNLRRLEAGFEGFEVFSHTPKVEDALYFGFENDLSFHILGFDMDFDPAGGAGVDPTQPPYVWEASTGDITDRWSPCEVEIDTSKGLNSAGLIRIHVPKMGKHLVNERESFWVRARVKEISKEEYKEGMRPYQISPHLRKAMVASWGGTIQAMHAQKISREFLGQSDGSPGQRFRLKCTPVLERAAGETLIVELESHSPEIWTEVRDFGSSGARDRHYTLDEVSGELRFGPSIRQQDGTIKLYGGIPPRGSNLYFDQYRYGGGQDGNVQPGIINTLKTAIPYIARVSNRFPASGGLDVETLASAMIQVPALLRSRDRAVTEADYEILSLQALPAEIERVKCLQPTPSEAGKIIPGEIYILVIPRVRDPLGHINDAELKLNKEFHGLSETVLGCAKVVDRPVGYSAPSLSLGRDQSQAASFARGRPEFCKGRCTETAVPIP